MKRAIAILFLIGVALYALMSLVVEPPADVRTDARVLKERAELAVELGDLRLARRLANELDPESAAVIRATADARDPDATAPELRRALAIVRDRGGEVHLEILARLPERHDEAVRLLAESCSIKGGAGCTASPWTIAAWARFEPEPFLRDGEMLQCSYKRHPRAAEICADAIPRPPLFVFRGPPSLYLAIGGAFLFFFVVLALRQNGAAPWTGKLLRWQLGAVLVSTLTALVSPDSPVLGVLAMLVVGGLAIGAEPLVYLALVRRGRFRRASIRLAGLAEDDSEENAQLLHVPQFVVHGFHSGSFFLERALVTDGGAYRNAAQTVPIARITVRPWWR